MLVLAKFRLRSSIVAKHTGTLVSSGVWHDDQVVEIHQETQEVEEGLSVDLVHVVSFWSVEEIPNILNSLSLLFQLHLIQSLNKS